MKHDITSPYVDLSRKMNVFAVNIIILFVLGFVGFIESSQASVTDPGLSPQEFRKLSPNHVVLLDTRSSWKFLLGHVPGAIRIDGWKEFTQSRDGIPGQLNRNRRFIAEKLSSYGIDYSKTIVLYGDPTDKWRTDGRFFWMFEYFGFKNTFLLKGGYDLWRDQGFPVERGGAREVLPSQLKAEMIQINPEVFADQNWVQKRLHSPEVVMIDNRERSEYEGSTPYGSTRGGHIPGAIHIDWRDFFTSQGLLKPKPELKRLLNQFRIKPNQEILVYCTGGVRSAMGYFVFRSLNYKVRNYDGSWWDWSHNPNLPVETT